MKGGLAPARIPSLELEASFWFPDQDLFGEAAASGDFFEQIGPLTLIRQRRHEGTVYNSRLIVRSVSDVK